MTREQIMSMLSDLTYKDKSITGELIETHISWVIICEDLVFKMKKPISYSFLDFSTLEKRKFYCERELKLNSRISDIYLDVVPVVEIDGKYSIGSGEGEIVDYALRMKKLDADLKMDVMIRENNISADHIVALAQKIAEFHENAEVFTEIISADVYKSVFNDISSNLGWIRGNLTQEYAEIVQEIISYSNAFIDDHYDLMKSRMENGFYRDVHGDLHSKNIFLYDDPEIFDCIEFNDEFRRIDLLNELAFFCMDLEAFGREDLCALFIEEYSKHFLCMRNRDEGLLFNYYKMYRANVRAKVNVLRAMQASEEELPKIKADVMKYLELCRKYIACGG